MTLLNFLAPAKTDRMAYLMYLVDSQIEEQSEIIEYRDYYDGQHEVMLNERQREFLGRSHANKFRLNQCPVVVESLVERLGVTGFSEIAQGIEPEQAELDAGEAPPPRSGLTDFTQRIWETNRMDAGQEEIYRQAAIDQRTYIILDIDPETGEIELHHNDAYTSSKAGGEDEGVKLHFATKKRRGRPQFATKRWAVQQGADAGYRRYLVAYYPDRIERYYQDDRERDGGQLGEIGWKPDVPRDGPLAGVWPTPWVDADNRPLGIPVVEFLNGRHSELHEVVPLQRALNKSVIDLIAAADQAGFGILFASGWAPTSDGKPIVLDSRGQVTSGNKPLTLESGVILFTTNPDGSLTRVPGDELDKLIQVVDRHILSIAQTSRTPISNFQLFGQIPAEGTQKQLEGGLTAKVKSRQQNYGNAWEDVMYLARRIALGVPVFEGGELRGYGLPAYESFGLDFETRLSTLWRDAETRNEKEHLESLRIKKELGVPERQIFLEMGYDETQADEFAGEAEARRLASAAAALEMTGGDGVSGG